MKFIPKHICISVLFFVLSCTENDPQNYRNSNYALFKPLEGKEEWIKLNGSDAFADLPPGEMHYFFDDGKTFAKLVIKDNYYKNRVSYFYNDSGKVYCIQKHRNDSMICQHYEDGYIREYYSSKRRLMSEGLRKNGKKEGLWKYYNTETGDLELTQEWKNGKQHGLREEFGPGQHLQNKSYWKDGKQDSIGIHYYPDGKIKDSVYALNGMQHGPAYHYFESGKLKALLNYENDQLKDSCFWYNEGGTLKKAEYHK